MITKAAILSKFNDQLSIEELYIPELKPGQVLVKIQYSGICRSQLNEIKGLKGEDKFLPHVLGHEGSGIVEKVGPDVKKVKAQDHVVITWIKSSGADIMCTRYSKADGTFVNSGAVATFMTRSIISENRLVKISKEMPLREAALLGCAIPTGAGMILNTARVRPGTSVAVFGIGGVGAGAIMAANIMSATTIIGIDIFDTKLDLARQLGATHLINSKHQNSLEMIKDITHGQGVDYAIEAVGKKEVMETAFQTVVEKCGLCILAGNLPYGERITIDPFDLIRGGKIIGSWGGETNVERDIPIYIKLYLSGKLKLPVLISHTCKLDEINKALRKMEEGQAGRILLDMT